MLSREFGRSVFEHGRLRRREKPVVERASEMELSASTVFSGRAGSPQAPILGRKGGRTSMELRIRGGRGGQGSPDVGVGGLGGI